MLTRRLLPWLVALALLFGQAAAFAHSLGHLDPHDGALPDKICEVCIAQAHLGSAAPQALFSLPVVSPETIVASTTHAPHTSPAARGAQARAPPAPV